MRKLMEDNVQPSKAAIQRILTGELSKSGKMKALFDLGLEVKEIADLMSKHEGQQVRYNFVYNVISNYCATKGIKVQREERVGKKQQIIELFLAGKTNKEISIDLQTNYNYVHNTIKQFKAETPQWEVMIKKPEQQAE